VSIAGGEGQRADHYSVQVEIDTSEPDFDIPFVGDDLSLADALAVFDRYRHRA